jgi:hypothetical protein
MLGMGVVGTTIVILVTVWLVSCVKRKLLCSRKVFTGLSAPASSCAHGIVTEWPKLRRPRASCNIYFG